MSHGKQDGGDTACRETITVRTTGLFLRTQHDPAPVIALASPRV